MYPNGRWVTENVQRGEHRSTELPPRDHVLQEYDAGKGPVPCLSHYKPGARGFAAEPPKLWLPWSGGSCIGLCLADQKHGVSWPSVHRRQEAGAPAPRTAVSSGPVTEGHCMPLPGGRRFGLLLNLDSASVAIAAAWRTKHCIQPSSLLSQTPLRGSGGCCAICACNGRRGKTHLMPHAGLVPGFIIQCELLLIFKMEYSIHSSLNMGYHYCLQGDTCHSICRFLRNKYRLNEV